MNVNSELQRYGRNKLTIVNSSYISSGNYRRKFDKITNNDALSRSLYSCAKKMLLHRSGTLFEDMYWLDSITGEVLASKIDSIEEEQIIYTESINALIVGRGNIIALHTHPCSMPPSIADFNSANEHNYELGIVICHDGKIFCYRSSDNISLVLYSLYVADYYNELHDEFQAQIHALNELSDIYDIEFWEVL